MNEHAFNRKHIIIISCMIIIGILIGSFFDYQISQALLNMESYFGKFFASYGQLPVTLGNAVIGFLLCYVTERKCRITTILAYTAAGLSYIMSFLMAIMDPMLYMNMPLVLAVILAIIEIILVSVISYRLARGYDKRVIKRFIAFLAFVIYGQLILINIIKPLAARPRMRMIVETPEASFQPWWVFGSEMKDTLMSTLGIASEEFKSFPSGHSGCAAIALAYCIIPYIRGRGSSNRWFYIGLGFALIVMLSRIIMGAHFLSDVMFGFGVSFFVMVIGTKLFYGGNRK